ncbi:MAG: hypothetical protein WBK06_08055 [Methanothrix sp.]
MRIKFFLWKGLTIKDHCGSRWRRIASSMMEIVPLEVMALK